MEKQRFVFTLIVLLSACVVCIQCSIAMAPSVPLVFYPAPIIHKNRLLVNAGQILTGSVFASFKVVGINMCAKECLLRRRCKTIRYNRNAFLCELGDDVSAIGLSDDVNDVVGYPSDWDIEESLAGQCAKHNCEVGTRCVYLTSKRTRVCIRTECPNPPPRQNTVSSFNSSERTVGSSISYGTCEGTKHTHGEQTITCLASGQWSSYSYACCDCDTTFTVMGNCECFKIRGPKKNFVESVGMCASYGEKIAVISSAEQLQLLSGIATSEIIRIDGKYSSGSWIFDDGTTGDWIENLPDKLKDFSSEPGTLAFKMTGSDVVLVDLDRNEKKRALCKKP